MEVVREVPRRLGRYEIVERLAAGGMGEVFVARSFGIGGFIKPVALKRVHPHLAGDENFVNMLHDEANVAAAIQHPNIVATIDVGCDGADHFVVLDYVSGDPLSRILRELKKRKLRMPPWAAVWIGAQVASALQAAHEARSLNGQRLHIVHRDVSLANIMLSDAGHPMLFDFGVAKAAERIHNTTSGELKGKLCYMAPETFHGVPVDRTTDIFSLGVVLYELLTARSPFQRESDLETIAALQRAVVPHPSEVRDGLDPALDAIVMRAMARDRAERYQGAADLEHALREWARANSAPHDASAVAAWLSVTFPERLHARRALLARVADPAEILVVEGPPVSLSDGMTPLSGPVSGRQGATPLSGRVSLGTPIATRGGTEIISASGITTSPPVGSGTTAFGIARSATDPGASSPGLVTSDPRPHHRRRWVPIVGGLVGAAVGIGGVVLLARPPAATPTTAQPDVAASSHTAPAPPPEPAPEAAAPSAGAETTPPHDAAPPANSAGASSQAAPGKRPVTTPKKPPAEAKTSSKSKGPLVRNYEP